LSNLKFKNVTKPPFIFGSDRLHETRVLKWQGTSRLKNISTQLGAASLLKMPRETSNEHFYFKKKSFRI